MAKDKKEKRIFKRLDDAFDRFMGSSQKKTSQPETKEEPQNTKGKLSPPIITRKTNAERQKHPDILKMEQAKAEKYEMTSTGKSKKKSTEDSSKATITEKKESKPETMTSVKKHVDGIVKKHLETIPPQSRIVSAKDIRKWVMDNPSLNINSPEFLAWCRNPDGNGVCPFVKHFGELLQELGIDHSCDVDVRGYVYDFFIEPMNLYIDIDPVSLETDDPNAKISITVNKNKLDVLGIWRNINESRSTRCKPYRFMSIKERLYAQGVKEFVQEYLDWYYQQMINKEK